MEHINTYGAIVLTGDRPTGPLHLGHYEGSLKARLQYQDKDKHELYVLIADTQVMNNDITKIKQVRKNIIEVMKDYLAVGLNPDTVNFFLQSDIPQLFELTNYLSNLVTLPQIMRNPTIKAETELYNQSLSMGFLNYPISQTADIVLFGADLVPVGEDQLPIVEFANDVVDKFNYYFNTDILKTVKPVLSENSRLTGLDGKNKMSKSLGNAIFLSDSEKVVNEQVYKMFTDSDHIKITDTGKIEGNVVFTFLDIYHNDKEEVKSLKEHYQKGGLGDVFLKKMLMKDLKEVLDPIREKRLKITDEYALEVLKKGTEKCRAIAEERLAKIKQAMFK